MEGEASRRDWILTHWPHIVEHAEIGRAESGPAPDLVDRRQELGMR